MAEDIKIHFLGTSGMMPEINRNHPAFLIRYKEENILIDCGEGTQIQFKKARVSPGKITRILLTHWHGDHTLGLPGLLKTLSMSNYTKELFIYGPKGIKKKIGQMFKAFGEIPEFEIKVEEVSGKFFENEEFYLEAAPMTHGTPCNAYNFVLKEKIRIDKKKLKKSDIKPGKHLQKLKEGKDVKYEGKKYKAKSLTFVEPEKKISLVLDTTENKEIKKLVKNADVLISEATFSSEEKDKAKEFRHMTVEQVAKIAKRAKVKELYLVHVSQRYNKNRKKILEEAKSIFKKSHMPKDLDKIKV